MSSAVPRGPNIIVRRLPRLPRRNAWPNWSESRISLSRGTDSARVRTRASSARSVTPTPVTMFAWAGATASWPNRTDPGGSRGLDDYFTRDFAHNIGAEIMGRNKFGPQRGPWRDHEWQGWWGDEPPFHTPVFVMTHHERPSFTLSDTTFHFVDGDPADSPRAGAGGRAGQGRPARRRGDHHPAVPRRRPRRHPACGGSPQVELGAGSRLWESPDELDDRFHHEVVPSSSGVTHHLFWRR